MKNAEILAPGGSFQSAYLALEMGADAVYVGLDRFSARKSAENLDLVGLSRLKGYAAGKGKKVYVAINTVIKTSEIRELIDFLIELSLLDIDGLIIQDFGILYLVKKYFPHFVLHGSTQMAVHNVDGAAFLASMGVRRVILAREVTLEQVKTIHKKVPSIELEMFIHGALCYGFSGLCLASGLLLGRSGNRGACAQVCRTWFSQGNKTGFFFSCNDLALKESLMDLKEAGVISFKIEGRMKSPEYAGNLAAYYRGLLSGVSGTQQEVLFKKGRILFARNQTKGFLKSPRGEALINSAYPSYMGIPLGKVLEVRGKKALIQLTETLEQRDGLLFFMKGELPEPVKCGVHGMFKNGQKVFKAAPGDKVFIEFSRPPQKGASVYKISAQSIKVSEKNPASFKRYKFHLAGNAVLTAERLFLEIRWPFFEEVWRFNRLLSAEESRKEMSLKTLLNETFAKSDKSSFIIDFAEVRNETHFPDDHIFISPKELKKIRRDAYEALFHFFAEIKQSFPDRIEKVLAGSEKNGSAPDFLRSEICYSAFKLPFIDSFEGAALEELPVYAGSYVLALQPLLDDSESYLTELLAFLRVHHEVSFLVGLNNPAHLNFIPALAKVKRVSFFIDYGLYCANPMAYSFFTELKGVPGFIIPWIEGAAEDNALLGENVSGPPLVPVDPAFVPHLFLSKVCFRKQSLGESCKGCKKGYEYELKQNKKRFRVVVRNCLTYVFLK